MRSSSAARIDEKEDLLEFGVWIIGLSFAPSRLT
jgi:hypothetical protein